MIWQFLKVLNTEFLYDPVISLRVYIQEKLKPISLQKLHINAIAALFMLGKNVGPA